MAPTLEDLGVRDLGDGHLSNEYSNVRLDNSGIYALAKIYSLDLSTWRIVSRLQFHRFRSGWLITTTASRGGREQQDLSAEVDFARDNWFTKNND